MAVNIKRYDTGSATSKSYLEHAGFTHLQKWDAEIYQKGSEDYVRFRGVKVNDMNIEAPLSAVTFEDAEVTKEELLELIELNK